MNLFKFLKNYKDTSVSQSYGDILEGKSDITDVMSDVEKSVYMQLKNNDKKSNDENARGILPIKQINYKDTKKSIVKIPTGAFFFNKNIYNTKTNFIVNYPNIEQGIEDIASALEIDINNKFNKINIEYDDFLDQYIVSCTLTISNAEAISSIPCSMFG